MSLLNSLKIEEKISKDNPNSSSFVFHHLPLGMGVTIGNYFRRCLLTYVNGISPIGVKIFDQDGEVKHKFTNLKGVKDLTFSLIANLRKIVLKEKELKNEIILFELNLENKGDQEKIVTAGDFSQSSEIEVNNPELYLTTLAPRAVLKIKMFCRKDWGYHHADQQKKYFVDEENVIILDTNYSPIKDVNFQVKSVAIGLKNEEEELAIDINTNGSVGPKEAFKQVLEETQKSFGIISGLLISSKKK